MNEFTHSILNAVALVFVFANHGYYAVGLEFKQKKSFNIV